MMKNELCTEAGYVSLFKHGEELCGDRVEMFHDGRQSLLVLADGLGSGVKANILSTLTSKIICTMLAGGMSIEECIDTVAATLPVSRDRGVAYSTFSLVRILDNRIAELTQYDNPPTIVLRNGKNFDYPYTTRTVAGKEIRESRFPIQNGDVIVALSDGAPYAGVGIKYNLGWQQQHIVEYLEHRVRPDMAAQSIAGLLTDKCNELYAGEPGDDTTAAVMRIRARHAVRLLIGPPSDPAMDADMLDRFFSGECERIVCGGTTAAIASRYLGKPLEPALSSPDPRSPPISTVEGIDLVTEGVVTLAQVLTYAEDFLSGKNTGSWRQKKDGASLIARRLFSDATDVHFFVGKAVNPAHQNPALPITFSVKIQLLERLQQALTRMGKHIEVQYF